MISTLFPIFNLLTIPQLKPKLNIRLPSWIHSHQGATFISATSSECTGKCRHRDAIIGSQRMRRRREYLLRRSTRSTQQFFAQSKLPSGSSKSQCCLFEGRGAQYPSSPVSQYPPAGTQAKLSRTRSRLHRSRFLRINSIKYSFESSRRDTVADVHKTHVCTELRS